MCLHWLTVTCLCGPAACWFQCATNWNLAVPLYHRKRSLSLLSASRSASYLPRFTSNLRDSNIQHFPSSVEQNTGIGWMHIDDKKTSLFVFALQILFDVSHQQGRNGTHGAGRILPFRILRFIKSGNKVMHTQQLVLFLWFATVNPSFHRASWLPQWPSNFGISQRQSDGRGVTFSSGTDSIFTPSFKTPYHSQQTHDMLMHQLKPLSWFHLLVNCAKWRSGGGGKTCTCKYPSFHWTMLGNISYTHTA